MDSHLSYPAVSEQAAVTPPPAQVRQVLKDRLYIGNLHPTVDEYTLLQVFSKFGKVTKLDFLFHKTGPCKGKPRGYAFVEYGSDSDALKALSAAHDKLLRGRKLVVTFAHQAPLEQAGAGSHGSSSGLGNKYRRGMSEASRPTTLSILKSGLGSRHDGTKDKIAMMEAKLRQMEQSKPPMASGSSSHPSLPSKPLPALGHHRPHRVVKPRTKAKTPLPLLPIAPSTGDGKSSSLSLISPSYGDSTAAGQHKTSVTSLVGVRICKRAERCNDTSA